MDLLSETYTGRQKKRITYLEQQSLKSTASKLVVQYKFFFQKCHQICGPMYMYIGVAKRLMVGGQIVPPLAF